MEPAPPGKLDVRAYDRMVAGLMKKNGVDEAMKARDQMGWVQAVNSFKAQAEEIVLPEIVYR